MPARIIRMVIEDPRGIPYRVLWREEYSAKIQEALKVALESANSVQLKRNSRDWQRVELRTMCQPAYPKAAWLSFLRAFGISEKYTYKPVD